MCNFLYLCQIICSNNGTNFASPINFSSNRIFYTSDVLKFLQMSHISNRTYNGWFLSDLLNTWRPNSFDSLPSGWLSVPLIFNDNGSETKGAIASGAAEINIDTTSKVPVVSSCHEWAIYK